MARVLGITFSIKLMEKGEQKAEKFYSSIIEQIPEAEKILAEENSHENFLIDMLDEEKLKYAGSIVLGLNDALIELTGALGYRARIRNHGHSCFLCEIVIRSQFHTTYEPEA
jgi:hypothetical protein